MKPFKSTLLILLAMGTIGFTLITFGAITPATSAAAAHHDYVTTPKSIRGTWLARNSAKHFKRRLKITKYTLTVTNYYKNGHKDAAASYTARGNKITKGLGIPSLIASNHKSAKGYWSVGLSQSNDDYLLKKVKHHNRTALRNYYPTFNPKHPTQHAIRYYYRVK